MNEKLIFKNEIFFLQCRTSPPTVQADLNTPEYLSQLLKDRRQLAAVPNMFFHVERLLDQGNYLQFFHHVFFAPRNQQCSSEFIQFNHSSKNRFTQSDWRKENLSRKSLHSCSTISRCKFKIKFCFGIFVRTNMHEGLFSVLDRYSELFSYFSIINTVISVQFTFLFVAFITH